MATAFRTGLETIGADEHPDVIATRAVLASEIERAAGDQPGSDCTRGG